MGRTIVVSLTLVSLAGIVAGTIITTVNSRTAARTPEALSDQRRGMEKRLDALESRLARLESSDGAA